jgi:MEDS: MEthanogen/methylotroph, DcmR Sensory domain
MVYACAEESRINDAVVTFIVSGLRNGDAVVLLISTLRRAMIEHRLEAESFDIQTIHKGGQLVFLDAATLLFAIMADGAPDVLILKRRLEELIEKASIGPASGQPRKVRIFGEMVNLLYMDGNISAATLVEELDNEVIAAYPSVTLFCAYSLRLDSDRLPQSLLDAHSHELSSLFE